MKIEEDSCLSTRAAQKHHNRSIRRRANSLLTCKKGLFGGKESMASLELGEGNMMLRK